MTAPTRDAELPDLDRQRIDQLERAVANGLKLARQYRASAAEAVQAGDNSIAKTLRLLAGICDRDAALAKAELWHRAAVRELLARAGRAHNAAKVPRPGRRPAMRDRLTDAMRPHRRDRVGFKELMRAWEQDVLGDGLRLHDLGDDRVLIVDETGDGGEVTYTRKYVERLYSEARKR